MKKFKCWHKERKEWMPVDVQLVLTATERVMWWYARDGGGYFLKDITDKVEIVFYIGINDKNDNEIYEGHVTSEGIVWWHDELQWDGGGSRHPGFYYKDVGKDLEYDGPGNPDVGALDYHRSLDDDVEIIGHIFESPELLR